MADAPGAESPPGAGSVDQDGIPALPLRDDVVAAAARLEGRVLTTPVVQRDSFSSRFGTTVYFKCENVQRTGSFKFRGAVNAVAQLPEAARRAGVATHSSGNHGAALALAATELGVPATVVMPRGASVAKRRAVLAYGGRVVDCGETLAEREAALAAVCRESGAWFVPPYDHPHIIAGQGTAALELTATVEALDEIWVPVGGGGLVSGTLLACGDTGPRVLGVEPLLADDAQASLALGRLQPQRPPRTVADGLRTAFGRLPFELARRYALQISTVPEAEILAAQRLVWERLKLVIEPSSAVPVAGLAAAVARNPDGYAGRRVGVILSGGNMAFPALEAEED